MHKGTEARGHQTRSHEDKKQGATREARGDQTMSQEDTSTKIAGPTAHTVKLPRSVI